MIFFSIVNSFVRKKVFLLYLLLLTLFYGMGKFVGIHVFILIHQMQGYERINVHKSASKR